MDKGNWVPICKNLARHLPKDRPFSKLEAAFSLQLDYDNGNSVTLSGYSRLWSWSKGKILRFFKEMGIKIKYPEDTTKKQNQNGLITYLIPDRSTEKTGLIRFVNSKTSQDFTDRSAGKNELITDRSRATTRDPNPKPIKNNVPFFEIIGYLNSHAGKKFKETTKQTRALIKARIRDGFCIDDFKTVIDTKVRSWLNDPQMNLYLRPQTLFGPKFESYLNESVNRQHPDSQTPREFDFENQFKKSA